jgi:hypothetical protein
MPDFVPVTHSDQAVVGGGDMHTVRFRPDQPGTVSVRSTASHAPTHSETGQLGRLDLLRPGSATPVASNKAAIGQNLLALTHAVTAAELAPAGDWTCRVFNATEANITFDTEITYPSTVQLEHKTATFDVELLDLILAEAVAAGGLGWHIESSGSPDDQRSFVSWSQNVGDSLPDPYKGMSSYWFQVPDYRAESDFAVVSATWVVIRITGFDSDPDAPVTAALSSENGVPALQVSVTFKPDTAKAVAIDSDVDLDKLDIELTVQSLTVDAGIDFYGNGLTVTPNLALTVTVAGIDIGLSSYVNDKVASAVNDHLAGLPTATLRQYIDDFFVNLMRLGTDATIQSYQSDGTTLTVNYTIPAPPHPVAVAGELH